MASREPRRSEPVTTTFLTPLTDTFDSTREFRFSLVMADLRQTEVGRHALRSAPGRKGTV